MENRLPWFLLGVVAVIGLSASGPNCPPGFRCGDAPAAQGRPCRITEGPYRGTAGTLVDGICLRTTMPEHAPTGAQGPHEHYAIPGHCPLCGTAGVEFLSFRVQGGRSSLAANPGVHLAEFEARNLLSCPTCGNLFTGIGR